MASYQNQSGMAIYHMNKALALAPDELSLRLSSVNILLRAGMWWEALNDAQTLYQRLPEHPKVVALYARVLVVQPAPEAEKVRAMLDQLDVLIKDYGKRDEEKVELLDLRKELIAKG